MGRAGREGQRSGGRIGEAERQAGEARKCFYAFIIFSACYHDYACRVCVESLLCFVCSGSYHLFYGVLTRPGWLDAVYRLF